MNRKFSMALPARLCGIAVVALLAGCVGLPQLEVPPHLRPLSTDAMSLLGKKGLKSEKPVFIRVFKEESELEVWKQRDDDTFALLRTYPICTWSGELGPKIIEGDKQSPEGFYSVPREQMNPNSQYHLSFNLGFPNAYDRTHGRTGSALMVHGKCKSVGCYAITDPWIEEVYALSREAFIGGQERISVHIFPFRMSEKQMGLHAASPHIAFWQSLKDAYDDFERSKRVPNIEVCDRRYIVNPVWRGTPPVKLDAEKRCPLFDRPAMPSLPRVTSGEQAGTRSIVDGPKQREVPADH